MVFALPRGKAFRAAAFLFPVSLAAFAASAPAQAQDAAPALAAHNLLVRMTPQPMGDSNAVRLWVRGDGGAATLRVRLFAAPSDDTADEAALTAPVWISAPVTISGADWREVVLPQEKFTLHNPSAGLDADLPAGDQPESAAADSPPHWADIDAVGIETTVPKKAVIGVDDIAWATLDSAGAGQSAIPVDDFETGDVAAWQPVGGDVQPGDFVYGVTTAPALVHGGRVAFQISVASPGVARVKALAAARQGMALTRKPYVVWTPPNRFDPILPTSLPPAGGASSFVNVQAAPGQTLGVGVCVYSPKALSDVTVTLPYALQGLGHILPKTAVDVRVVKTDVEPGGGLARDDNFDALTPDILVKDDRISLSGMNTSVPLTGAPVTDIPADSAKEFWVTLTVPAQTRPGAYSGSLKMSGTGLAVPITVPVSLTVLPIQFASSPAKQYAINLRSRLDPAPDTLPGADGHTLVTDFVSKDTLDAQLADIHAHGFDIATLYDSPDTLWDAVAEYETAGFRTPYNLYMGDGDPAQIETQRAAHNAPQMEFFVDPNDTTRAARVADLGKHGFPVTTYVTRLSDYNALQANLDVPVYSADSDYSRAMMQTHGRRVNFGHDWWYWPAAQESPLADRLDSGWSLWRANLFGAYVPDYQTAFGTDPYDLASHGAAPGDAALRSQMLTYPVQGGVLDTLRWEAIREGVTDVLYLTTLYQVLRQCKDAHIAKPLTDKAQAYVAGFLDKSPEALSDADLDAARAQVAQFTVTLGAQLAAYNRSHHVALGG